MEIILLIIAGTVSGCDGWKSLKDFGEAKLDWLRKFLPYKDGIPVHDTLARVMRKIETKSFQACFMKWVQSVSEATSGDVVAIDGKTLRRSHNNRDGIAAIHMVSAWSSENGLVLGQEKKMKRATKFQLSHNFWMSLSLKGASSIRYLSFQPLWGYLLFDFSIYPNIYPHYGLDAGGICWTIVDV